MRYASVYRRPRSSSWYISFWCPSKQKRLHRTTPYRIDEPNSKANAMELAEYLSKEAVSYMGTAGEERWECWVEDFLARIYSGPNRVKTLVRFRNAWKQWRVFLNEQGIVIPRTLTYNHVIKFISWRTAQVKRVSGKHVSRNTASTDIKLFSIIMGEALKKGFADKNPCKELRHCRDEPAQKPEITAEEIETIRRELKTRPEWMSISFEIAIHQGCRLSETSMPLSKVNLERGEIEFKAKGRGGKPHKFITQLHPNLQFLMARLKAEKRALTCELPVMAAWKWHGFFKEIGLPHLCFHCTRVTVITRMARAGVPLSQSMAYVGHATELIHRVYTRLNSKDVSRAVAALDFSPPQADAPVAVLS